MLRAADTSVGGGRSERERERARERVQARLRKGSRPATRLSVLSPSIFLSCSSTIQQALVSHTDESERPIVALVVAGRERCGERQAASPGPARAHAWRLGFEYHNYCHPNQIYRSGSRAVCTLCRGPTSSGVTGITAALINNERD